MATDSLKLTWSDAVTVGTTKKPANSKVTRREFDRLRSRSLSIHQMLGLLDRCVLDHLIRDQSKGESNLINFYEAYFGAEGTAGIHEELIPLAFVSALDELAQFIPTSKPDYLRRRFAVIRDVSQLFLIESKSQRESYEEALLKVQKELELLELFFDRIMTAVKHAKGLRRVIAEAQLSKTRVGIVSIRPKKRKTIEEFLDWLDELRNEAEEYRTDVFAEEKSKLKWLEDGFVGSNKFYSQSSKQIHAMGKLGADGKQQSRIVDLISKLIVFSQSYNSKLSRGRRDWFSEKERAKATNATLRTAKDRVRKIMKRGVSWSDQTIDDP